MVHYRSLFDELLEDSADRPLDRDEARASRAADEQAVR
jgi:hypothetical protein